MALSGLLVGGNDHFAKGGVKKMELGSYLTGEVSSLAISATGVASGTIATSPVTIEFKKESANMQVTSSNDFGKGLTTHEIVIEGYVPDITQTRLVEIQEMVNTPLVAKVYTWDGETYLVGWDGISSETDDKTRFPMELTSAVSDTGSALSDENGVTLTFTCLQAEAPAKFA
jgi:hypothetical protein